MKSYALGVVAALFSALCATAATAANLTLAVEPNYPQAQAAEVYQPLLAYLKSATGHTVTLLPQRNYHFFWRDLRNDTPADLMFAEAHFTDYRIQRFKAVPLVRTAERSSYTLLGSDQLQATRLEELVGKNIVTMPSPSLGFALLLEMFPSPIAQPNILSTAASWRDGPEIVFAGEADAAIVPTWLQAQYPNLVPLRTSRDLPGPAFTASAKLDAAVRDSIEAALLKLHENADAYNVLNELGVTRFEKATAEEYRGSEAMLRDFFGYQ
jgi:ABC-type phosphate/phosphonate transport system substrate-binding protein